MDFTHSTRAAGYLERVQAFIAAEIDPVEGDYLRERHAAPDPWVVLPVVGELKAKAREQGLWNLFMPDDTHGAGLTNVEYAPLAEAMGHSVLAPEVFNCSAPDTGNMEVLHRYGSDAQQEQWLDPLLRGEIRSAFCMTEPEVASSDATNMAATAVVDGDKIVLNGRKWSGPPPRSFREWLRCVGTVPIRGFPWLGSVPFPLGAVGRSLMQGRS